jgi:hypothetical protein
MAFTAVAAGLNGVVFADLFGDLVDRAGDFFPNDLMLGEREILGLNEPLDLAE